jgi:hypothetical protein
MYIGAIGSGAVLSANVRGGLGVKTVAESIATELGATEAGATEVEKAGVGAAGFVA